MTLEATFKKEKIALLRATKRAILQGPKTNIFIIILNVSSFQELKTKFFQKSCL
jgi:hypothetical protein